MSDYPLEWGVHTDAPDASNSAAIDAPPTPGRYPLEWGWHVPPDPSATPVNAKLWPTLLGVGDNDAILAASTPTAVISASAPGKASLTGAISATPESTLPSLDAIAGGAASITKRAAPYLPRIAGAAGAAGSILLTPGNTQESYTDLGDGLRVRTAPGEKFPKIQRRTGGGVFGSDMGARWETVPVDAQHGSDAEGRRTIVIHRGQLESAIGAERAAEVARVPGVSLIEGDEFEEGAKRPPTGSRPIDQTPWSGDHENIKGGISANPDDNVRISPDGNVWLQNPDGTWTNHGPADSFTGSGKASGRRGKDRDQRRDEEQ